MEWQPIRGLSQQSPWKISNQGSLNNPAAAAELGSLTPMVKSNTQMHIPGSLQTKELVEENTKMRELKEFEFPISNTSKGIKQSSQKQQNHAWQTDKASVQDGGTPVHLNSSAIAS